MPRLLEVYDLYDPTRLRGLSFSIAAGEVLALVGSHGNGKDALLAVLTGRSRPSQGYALVDGIPPHHPEAVRRIGAVGQAWSLHPSLTVGETLRLFAGLWNLSIERAEEIAAALDLIPLWDRKAIDLSPGQSHRLRLGRALLHDPPILLLDEPIGDIDRESTAILESLISTAAEQGKAVLIATFGHPRAVRLASQVLYMEEGRLVAPPNEGIAETEQQTEEPPRSAVHPIAARRGERLLLIAPEEILYAFAQEKSVYLHTREGDYTVSFTLAELEERLVNHGFFRAHRAFLVNLAQVREIAAWSRSSFSLRLKNGGEVPLSKHRVQELRELLGW